MVTTEIRTLAGTAVAVAAAAVAGSSVSRTGVQTWYARLRKPPYVPPNYVFPAAWTVLYGDIAVSSAVAIDRFRAAGQPAQVRALIVVLGTNLVLNAGWSWLFFNRQKLGASAVGAAVLSASSADLARRVGEADTRAGLALAPYPLWCTFATVMSTHIWWLNR